MGFRKARIAFEDFYEVGDPKRGGAGEYVSDSTEIEIAGPALGEIDIAHGFERNTNEKMEPIALRSDKCLDDDIVRDVVSGCATWKKQI